MLYKEGKCLRRRRYAGNVYNVAWWTESLHIASLTMRARCTCLADITPAVTWVIYTIICLWTFAKCRSQVLLDCLGRCLKLIASSRGTSCHESASHFGLEFFYTRKNRKPESPDHRPFSATDRQNGATIWKAYNHARWWLTSQFLA